MKQRRLTFLLAAMLVLIVLRWWSPPLTVDSAQVEGTVPAVVRSSASSAFSAAASGRTNSMMLADLSGGTRDIESLELRNAFAVRRPPQAPQPPSPMPVAANVAPPMPFVGPPMPPPASPPPPPPFQVIGSWRDEQGASLFIAGPRGVQQIKVGDILADYRVSTITVNQVMLKHLSSNRDVPLSVPPGAAATLLSSN